MPARLLSPFSALAARIQGFWIGKGTHLKIILATILALVILVGGFVGTQAVQAFQLLNQASHDINAHNYTQALSELQAAAAKFPPIQAVTGPQINQINSWMTDDKSVASARVSEKANDYKGCLDAIKNIKSDYPGFGEVTYIQKDCQTKLAAVPTVVAPTTPAPSTGTTTKTAVKKTTTTNTQTPTAQTTTTTTAPASSSDCSGKAYFTVSPIATSDTTGIVPLGSLNPTGHTFPTNHIYFYIRLSGGTPVQTPLYAPGNITITSISADQHVTGGFTDYQLYFKPCSQITGMFDHVSSLTQAVLDQFNAGTTTSDSTYSTGGETYHKTTRTVSIPLSAGGQIGTAGGTHPGQLALDFQVQDTRSYISFANNGRWNFEHNIVCPLDYYSGGIAGTLTSLLGDYSGSPRRTAAPLCGQYDQDAAGTMQGTWFAAGVSSTYPEDPNLSLVHDNVQPNYGAISVGTTLANGSGVATGVYYFTPTSSGLVNRDFGGVTDNQIYCYDTSDGKGQQVNTSFIIQLSSSTTLQIQKIATSPCGAGPWSFTSASQFTR